MFAMVTIAACSSSKKISETSWKESATPEKEISRLRQMIKAPVFPSAIFNVKDYGAVGDGKTMNTAAFKKAIEDCNKKGGGHVLVPFGDYLTGAIYLKSNVDLHLADSTIIRFSTNPKDYPIVFGRWEGMELMNYSALIYAYGEKNIAVSGKRHPRWPGKF